MDAGSGSVGRGGAQRFSYNNVEKRVKKADSRHVECSYMINSTFRFGAVIAQSV
jgi:hypothetical protein